MSTTLVEALALLQAGYVPGQLLPDALATWVGPVEFADALVEGGDRWVPAMSGGIVEHDRHLLASLNGADGPYGRRVARIRFSTKRAEVRHRVCVVMAAGLRCMCDNGNVQTAAGTDECGACYGSGRVGYVRAPAPCWRFLPEHEGGQLPQRYAEHAPLLIAAHVAAVTTGRAAVCGLLGEWDPEYDCRWSEVGQWRTRSVVGRVERDFEPCGWRFGPPDETPRAQGPELGDEGCALGDAAALAWGFALLDNGILRVAWPMAA